MSGFFSPLLLLLCWVLLAASLLGLGLAVDRLVSVGGVASGRGAFAYLWIGLTGVVLFLQIAHFFVPISRPLALAMVLTGLILLLGSENRGFLREAASRATQSGRIVFLVAVALLLGWFLAYRALGQPSGYDTGMYHLPAVEWFRSFPVVPGLANLHGRLGFNNSSLLLAGWFDAALPTFRSWHVTNGFFLFLLSLRFLTSWTLLPNLRGDSKLGALYDLVLAPVLLVLALDPLFVSSLTVEVPVAVGVFFTGRWLLSMDGTAPTAGTDFRTAFTALLVFALLVTFKLSTLAWAAAGTAVLLWVWWRRLRAKNSTRARRVVGVGLAVAALLVATWTIRSVALSGYLAYPSAMTAVPVEWRAPLEQAAAEQAWIEHYARYFFGHGMGPSELPPYGIEWLVAWGSAIAGDFRHRWLVFYPLLVSAGFSAAIAALRLQLIVSDSRAGVGELLLPAGARRTLLTLAAALAFWFLMAPRPTLGFFFVWGVAAVLGASFLAILRRSVTLPRSAAVALAAVPLLAPVLLETPSSAEGWAATVARRLADRQLRAEILPPQSNGYLRRYATDSGLQLWVPRDDNRCWDAPLPCTPHPSANLRLREPGEQGSGFVLDGDWNPSRWPNSDSDFLERWREAGGT